MIADDLDEAHDNDHHEHESHHFHTSHHHSTANHHNNHGAHHQLGANGVGTHGGVHVDMVCLKQANIFFKFLPQMLRLKNSLF